MFLFSYVYGNIEFVFKFNYLFGKNEIDLSSIY